MAYSPFVWQNKILQCREAGCISRTIFFLGRVFLLKKRSCPLVVVSSNAAFHNVERDSFDFFGGKASRMALKPAAMSSGGIFGRVEHE